MNRQRSNNALPILLREHGTGDLIPGLIARIQFQGSKVRLRDRQCAGGNELPLAFGDREVADAADRVRGYVPQLDIGTVMTVSLHGLHSDGSAAIRGRGFESRRSRLYTEAPSTICSNNSWASTADGPACRRTRLAQTVLPI